MPKYTYPAIFTPDKELLGYYVAEFPDIDSAVTQGKNFSQAYKMAEDVLNLSLMTLENDGDKIPAPTKFELIESDEDKIIGLVEADTDAYRKNFHDGLSYHDIWFSPVTGRRFFVLKDDDEEVCGRVEAILRKISGVTAND